MKIFRGGFFLPVEIISEKYLTLSEVREILEEREKEGRLNHAQRNTLEYVRLFAKLPAKKSRELVNALVEKYRLRELTATQIANVLPRTIEELRVFLTDEVKVFTKDELEEMLSVINSFSEEG